MAEFSSTHCCHLRNHCLGRGKGFLFLIFQYHKKYLHPPKGGALRGSRNKCYNHCLCVRENGIHFKTINSKASKETTYPAVDNIFTQLQKEDVSAASQRALSSTQQNLSEDHPGRKQVRGQKVSLGRPRTGGNA